MALEAALNGPPATPDGRYIVVRGRLWRRANPALPDGERQEYVDRLMAARRQIGVAARAGDTEALTAARREVHGMKVALGERGPVWWNAAEGDFNRHLARNTPYAAWAAAIEAST